MARVVWWMLLISFQRSIAQPPELMQGAVGKKPSRLAKTEPFIKCNTCKLAATEAWLQVANKAAELPRGTLGEVEIGEVLDAICDADDDLGEWITFYDIEQKDGEVMLENKTEVGECRKECTTLMHACRAVFDEHREDMTEMLFKHYRLEGKESKRLSLEKFVSRLCNKMSKACPGKRVPAGFEHRDEPWMPILDPEGYRMRKMQHALNKQSKDFGSQPVQFLDPMGSLAMAEIWVCDGLHHRKR
eukprot:symbB.v1.2.021132.t1/scaffold1809.1/size100517/7